MNTAIFITWILQIDVSLITRTHFKHSFIIRWFTNHTFKKENPSIAYIITLICKLDGVKIIALLTFSLFLKKKKKTFSLNTKPKKM